MDFKAKVWKGNTFEEKVLREFKREDVQGRTFVGSAYGADVGHCVYIALRHTSDLWGRTAGFYVNPEENDILRDFRKQQADSIRVDFYG